MVARCLEAAKRSAQNGTWTRVVEMHSARPPDRELVARSSPSKNTALDLP